MKRSEGYPTPRIEANAFPLEEESLIRLVPGSNTDCALRIYDALPGDRRAGGKRVKCVTHQACLPRQPGEARYLAVGSYAPAGDPRHDILDAAMKSFGCDALHAGRYARTASIVSASPALLSGRYPLTRANLSVTPPGYCVLR